MENKKDDVTLDQSIQITSADEQDDMIIAVDDEDFYPYDGELEAENYLDYFADDNEYDAYDDDNNDEEDDDYFQQRQPRPLWQRLIAFITVLAFAGLAVVTAWPALRLPLPDVLIKSILTEKDVDVQRLEQAVVQINVLSRPAGSVGVKQKSGTGFNIDPTGTIITNHHVIDGAVNLSVTFPNGKIYKAEHWASDATVDLAVITLKSEDLPTVPVNHYDLPVHGDKVKIVGNPLGLNNVVVEGKALQYGHIKDNPNPVLIMDAPVYPGNSGSPVFNHEGQVVAVVFASLPQKDQEYPLGLAVPIAASVELQQKQTIPKPDNTNN